MFSIKAVNKYDRYLFLLISSLAFGGIGGAITITRALAIIFIPAMIKARGQCLDYTKSYWSFFRIFYVFCLVSILWSPDKTQGVKEIVYFFVHFMLFFEIIIFSRFALHSLDSISKGWLCAVSLTLVLAAWELLTDQHLNISVQESGSMMNAGGGLMLEHRFASCTFGNYNGYVTFLCFAVPFLFYRILKISSIKLKNLYLILVLLLSYVVILLNASRGGTLAVGLMFMIYLIFSKPGKLKFLIFLIIFILGAYIVSSFGDVLFSVLSARLARGETIDDSPRIEIWKNVIAAYGNTFGLGTGVGGIMSALLKVDPNGIAACHNLFLEIMLEFGFIFLLPFIYFLWKILKAGWHFTDNSIKTFVLVSIIPLPIYSIINSGYILNPIVFAAFSSLVVFVLADSICSRKKEIGQ